MIADLRPYPAMKNSGVPWLGEVPAHWRLERARNLVTKVDRPVRASDEVVTCFRDGTVTLRKNRRTRGFTEALKEIGYQGIRAGDLVIHAMDAFAGAAGVADCDGKGSPVYAVCEPRPSSNTYYQALVIREMARSQWILALATGIRERSTDFRFGTFANQTVPLPPLREQAAIVRFLDYVDRRIRRYIRAKQKLIKLLEEQKQAITHRGVTRGLDPNVRLKPSGVDWAGDVPEHWEVRRLKWVTRLQRGFDLPADRRVAGPFPVVSSGGVIDTHSEFKCRGPGVVMGRYGSTEAVFYIARDFWPHNTSLFVTDFQGNLPMWCYHLLRSISKADHSGKSAVPGVDRKDLFQIPVPVPPPGEQSEIVEAIEARSQKLSDAVSLVQRDLCLLREFRTRLIADVVTGKLDVRDAAARLRLDDDLGHGDHDQANDDQGLEGKLLDDVDVDEDQHGDLDNGSDESNWEAEA